MAETKLPKILVISDYRPTVGARPEAEIFIGLAKRGFKIDIFTYPGADYTARFRDAGIEVTEWHPDKKIDRAASNRIREKLVDGKHDILQMFNSHAYYNGIRAAKALPVKVVMYRGYQGNLEWYQPGLYLRYFHPRVNKIVCNSIGVEEEFRKNPFINWDKKLVTINKGHRLEWYADVQPADLSTFGVKPGSVVFTCIANVRRMKGVKYLLQALKLLPPGLDITLLMVGNGLDNPEYRKLANDSAYRDRIIFAGFQSNPLEIDKASDVFVLASIYGESITKAVIEAMAVGTAPLITNIPGNKFLIENGISGMMIAPRNPQALADGITSLYQRRGELPALGAAAQARIGSDLNSEKTIKEYGDFYIDLASGKDNYRTKPGVM